MVTATWSSTEAQPVVSAATVAIVSAARAAVLRTAEMISGFRRPVTERHAPATIGRRRGLGCTPTGFPEAGAHTPSAVPQRAPSRATACRAHSGLMTVVTQLLAAVGTLTAVVLILLMAAVPLLLDLPQRSAPHSQAPRRKGR